MGRVNGGEHVTPLGCGIRVLNVEREDGNDTLLSLTMVDPEDDRRVEVLLDNNARYKLISMLTRQGDDRWPNMTPHQLLEEAQEVLHNQGPRIAEVLVAVAQAQAAMSLEWTIENRLIPSMGQRP
jgi:hypothetical protein